MLIFGINTGLNSSVAVCRDGEMLYGIQEERLSRLKNQPGFPSLGFESALTYLGISKDQIDMVCVGGKSSKIVVTRGDDIKKYDERYSQIKSKWFTGNSRSDGLFHKSSLEKWLRPQTGKETKSLEDYLERYDLLDIHKRYDHHTCHAAAAYYGLSIDSEDSYLIFTMDGGGDRKTSAVFTGKDGKLTEIASSYAMSLASMYAHITYILGFTPHEHEYKLMGLAPYANVRYAEEVKESLQKFIELSADNPMIFTNTSRYPNQDTHRGPDKLRWIEDLFSTVLHYRFDTLCAGLQLFVEELALEWVKTAIKTTGIKKILLSGGFFMNVKVNQLIADLEEVESVNCFPSCGDETNAMGAAFLGFQESLAYQANSKNKKIVFGNFCLGPEPVLDVEDVNHKYSGHLIVEYFEDINRVAVDLLCESKIVARCSGRMEFGARALGNRSILATPDDPRIVNKINRAIKQRDFWMPFAPAVILEEAETIITIPNSLKTSYSPYMMFTFPVVPESSDKIIAGIHQSDQTARAQLVSKELYPEFYKLITEFYRKTGIPALLNTSFNLHGYPIVSNVEEAVEVFLNSEIDALIIDNWLVLRR